jgi:type II secretory ATPase GspE/PulE/Tfp pilus assembly ATPase PilB-like protein
LAELSLWCRELGLMLQNGADLVAALSVLERQDFSPAIRSMTTQMVEQASADGTLEELVGARAEVFPPICILALQMGEASRRLPETLMALADCLAQAAELGMNLGAEPTSASEDASLIASAGQRPAVRVVNSIFGQAIKAGIREVRVHASEEAEETRVSFEIDGTEQEVVTLPIDVLGPICRRVCVMAQINWWSKEPALGTLTFNHRGSDVVGSVRFIPGDSEQDQQVYVSFSDLPQDRE